MGTSASDELHLVRDQGCAACGWPAPLGLRLVDMIRGQCSQCGALYLLEKGRWKRVLPKVERPPIESFSVVELDGRRAWLGVEEGAEPIDVIGFAAETYPPGTLVVLVPPAKKP